MDHKSCSKDFANLCEVDLQSKLQPITTSIDDMLARLEEVQTIVSFAKQEATGVSISVITDLKHDVDDLCNRIDVIENLIVHITNNIDMLESTVNKHENELNQPNNKVTSIFTPLFKRTEKKAVNNCKLFETSEYFK